MFRISKNVLEYYSVKLLNFLLGYMAYDHNEVKMVLLETCKKDNV